MMLEQLNNSDLRGSKDEKLLIRQSMGWGWLEPGEIKGNIIAKELLLRFFAVFLYFWRVFLSAQPSPVLFLVILIIIYVLDTSVAIL